MIGTLLWDFGITRTLRTLIWHPGLFIIPLYSVWTFGKVGPNLSSNLHCPGRLSSQIRIGFLRTWVILMIMCVGDMIFIYCGILKFWDFLFIPAAVLYTLIILSTLLIQSLDKCESRICCLTCCLKTTSSFPELRNEENTSPD